MIEWILNFLPIARMWMTASIGRISSKDQAVEWAIPKLSMKHVALLEREKKAYVGEKGMETEIMKLVNDIEKEIESSLNRRL